MIFSCSMTEPGHPCVTIMGSARRDHSSRFAASPH
jgi:hypothetical protein